MASCVYVARVDLARSNAQRSNVAGGRPNVLASRLPLQLASQMHLVSLRFLSEPIRNSLTGAQSANCVRLAAREMEFAASTICLFVSRTDCLRTMCEAIKTTNGRKTNWQFRRRFKRTCMSR